MDILSVRVKNLDICIADESLCLSLCEGRLKFSPCSPISSLHLGPRGITPTTCVAFPPLLLFSKMFTRIEGAHARHVLQGGWGDFTKLDYDFLKRLHFTSVYPHLKLVSCTPCTRITLGYNQQCLSPCRSMAPWASLTEAWFSSKTIFCLRPILKVAAFMSCVGCAEGGYFRSCRRPTQGHCLHNCFVHKYNGRVMLLLQRASSLA